MLSALEGKMKFFLVFEGATELVLSRVDNPFLPQQLLSSLSTILSYHAQLAARQPQSSINREIDASAHFERLPFGRFFIRITKTKRARLD